MGGNQMIDLISHGLALRTQLSISSEINPQAIRTISAHVISELAKESATSSESATINTKNRDSIYCKDYQVASASETADLAEGHSRQGKVIADDSRKYCGLNTAHVLTFDNNPNSVLEVVTCNSCVHFSPDKIGDGAGIGDCYLNVKWTQEFDGRRPLYRYAERHCEKYSNTRANFC
jgi:hypothetical protein